MIDNLHWPPALLKAGWPSLMMVVFIFSWVAPALADDENYRLPTDDLDRALQRRVHQFLRGEPSLASASSNQQIQILVYNGKVTLRGEVESVALRQVMENRAAEIAGRELTDELTIRAHQAAGVPASAVIAFTADAVSMTGKP